MKILHRIIFASLGISHKERPKLLWGLSVLESLTKFCGKKENQRKKYCENHRFIAMISLKILQNEGNLAKFIALLHRFSLKIFKTRETMFGGQPETLSRSLSSTSAQFLATTSKHTIQIVYLPSKFEKFTKLENYLHSNVTKN